MRSLLVYPLASRIAVIVASVPELTSLIICMDGKYFFIVSANSSSILVGTPKDKPFSSLDLV